ncbi:MAG: ATP-binding protein [Bradymonadales bacterium]|nr:MAG: ATP-binding protein [Bradymonadales bacterium]
MGVFVKNFFQHQPTLKLLGLVPLLALFCLADHSPLQAFPGNPAAGGNDGGRQANICHIGIRAVAGASPLAGAMRNPRVVAESAEGSGAKTGVFDQLAERREQFLQDVLFRRGQGGPMLWRLVGQGHLVTDSFIDSLNQEADSELEFVHVAVGEWVALLDTGSGNTDVLPIVEQIEALIDWMKQSGKDGKSIVPVFRASDLLQKIPNTNFRLADLLVAKINESGRAPLDFVITSDSSQGVDLLELNDSLSFLRVDARPNFPLPQFDRHGMEDLLEYQIGSFLKSIGLSSALISKDVVTESLNLVNSRHALDDAYQLLRAFIATGLAGREQRELLRIQFQIEAAQHELAAVEYALKTSPSDAELKRRKGDFETELRRLKTKLDSGVSKSLEKSESDVSAGRLKIPSRSDFRKAIGVQSQQLEEGRRRELEAELGLGDVKVYRAEDLEAIDWFKDVFGLDYIRDELLDLLAMNRTASAYSDDPKVRATIRRLLYGLPGTGKTFIMKALGRLVNSPAVFIVDGSSVKNWYTGGSEARIAKLFDRIIQEALLHPDRPILVYFDEIDALTATRDSTAFGNNGHSVDILTMILQRLHGAHGKLPANVHVLAGTNRPWAIDPAVLRPGRIGQKTHIRLPDAEARMQMLQGLVREGYLPESFDLDMLVEHTEDWSAASIMEALVAKIKLTHHRKNKDIAADELGLSDLDLVLSEDSSLLPKMRKALQAYRERGGEEILSLTNEEVELVLNKLEADGIRRESPKDIADLEAFEREGRQRRSQEDREIDLRELLGTQAEPSTSQQVGAPQGDGDIETWLNPMSPPPATPNGDGD